MTESRSRLLLAISLLLTLAVAANALLLQGGRHNSVSAAAVAGSGFWWNGGATHDTRAGSRPAGAGSDSEASPLGLARLDNQLVVESGKRDAQLVRAIQRELAVRAYAPGPVDGVAGLVTRSAIMAFERDAGLPLTAEPSDALLQSIVLGLTLSGDDEDDAAAQADNAAGRITLAVQAALLRFGYEAHNLDGETDAGLRRAIERFEGDSGMKPTGRISGPLAVALLRRVAIESSLAGGSAGRQ